MVSFARVITRIDHPLGIVVWRDATDPPEPVRRSSS